MHNRGCALALAVALFFTTGSTLAQGLTVGVTGGYRFGGDFEEAEYDDADNEQADEGQALDLDEAGSFGVIVTIPEGPNTDYELFFNRQNTRLTTTEGGVPVSTLDVTVDYWQFGGTVLLEGERLIPFVSGSVGLAHFDPDLSGGSSETRFSLSLGGGVKVPLSKVWELRFDLRGFMTALDSGGSMFCANGGCAVRVAASAFFQADLSAGLSYRFN